MKYYIIIVLIYFQIVYSYINIPLLKLRKNKLSLLNGNKNNFMDCNKKFIYKNYLLSIRKVKKTMQYSSSVVDINNIFDNIISSINANNSIDNKEAIIYLKNNNTLIDNNDFIAKKLILSNIHIDVSNIKQIHISTNNDTLIVNLDKNDIQTRDMSKYELGKIDALLNVASIITSIMNN
jgi:hypothetical protein